jgi:hypothetical protein
VTPIATETSRNVGSGLNIHEEQCLNIIASYEGNDYVSSVEGPVTVTQLKRNMSEQMKLSSRYEQTNPDATIPFLIKPNLGVEEFTMTAEFTRNEARLEYGQVGAYTSNPATVVSSGYVLDKITRNQRLQRVQTATKNTSSESLILPKEARERHMRANTDLH